MVYIWVLLQCNQHSWSYWRSIKNMLSETATKVSVRSCRIMATWPCDSQMSSSLSPNWYLWNKAGSCMALALTFVLLVFHFWVSAFTRNHLNTARIVSFGTETDDRLEQALERYMSCECVTSTSSSEYLISQNSMTHPSIAFIIILTWSHLMPIFSPILHWQLGAFSSYCHAFGFTQTHLTCMSRSLSKKFVKFLCKFHEEQENIALPSPTWSVFWLHSGGMSSAVAHQLPGEIQDPPLRVHLGPAPILFFAEELSLLTDPRP